MISDKRRNYSELLKSLDNYYSKYPYSKINLILLGKLVHTNDNYIEEYCSKINNKYGKKIKYWTCFIDQKEFDKEILNSDIILSNLYPTKKIKGILEMYGISKETGISYVLYKYAKPGLVPLFQKILNGFDSQLIKYKSYFDLIKIFRQIDNEEYDIRKLKSEAVINMKRFNQLIEKESQIFIQYLTK
jgi:hypothetical protein